MPTESEYLFRGFSEQEKREFLRTGIRESFRLHENILEEGAPGTHMYIILEGEVSIWLKSAKLLGLKRGDLIGVTVIVQPHTRMATVLAESTVTLLRFNREDVMNFFKNKPAHLFQKFCVNSLKIVVNMIRKTNQHIAELERLLRERSIVR